MINAMIGKEIINRISEEVRTIIDKTSEVYILDDYTVILIKTFTQYWMIFDNYKDKQFSDNYKDKRFSDNYKYRASDNKTDTSADILTTNVLMDSIDEYEKKSSSSSDSYSSSSSSSD